MGLRVPSSSNFGIYKVLPVKKSLLGFGVKKKRNPSETVPGSIGLLVSSLVVKSESGDPALVEVD